MKTEFVMFHCYNDKKRFLDHKDCVGSFGMSAPEGATASELLSLVFEYMPLSTAYITFRRLKKNDVFKTPIEIEEMK